MKDRSKGESRTSLRRGHQTLEGRDLLYFLKKTYESKENLDPLRNSEMQKLQKNVLISEFSFMNIWPSLCHLFQDLTG